MVYAEHPVEGQQPLGVVAIGDPNFDYLIEQARSEAVAKVIALNHRAWRM